VVNFPDPVYGHQLQYLAVPGLAAEGKMAIIYSEERVTLGHGETVSLRRPGDVGDAFQIGLGEVGAISRQVETGGDA
ncbi:hypothetical protein AB9F41_38795, partial [Rhizobium leguminosarum]